MSKEKQAIIDYNKLVRRANTINSRCENSPIKISKMNDGSVCISFVDEVGSIPACICSINEASFVILGMQYILSSFMKIKPKESKQ